MVTRRKTYYIHIYLLDERYIPEDGQPLKKLVVVVLRLVVVVLQLGVVGPDHTRPVWAEPCSTYSAYSTYSTHSIHSTYSAHSTYSTYSTCVQYIISTYHILL